MKWRKNYFIFFLIWFVNCVLIVRLFHLQPFIRGFIGDVIVILLLYCFIQSFFHFSTRKLVLSLWLFACVLEFLQYAGLVNRLGLAGNRLAVVVLGATFDPVDLLAYTVGALLVLAFEQWMFQRSQRIQPNH